MMAWISVLIYYLLMSSTLSDLWIKDKIIVVKVESTYVYQHV